MKLELKHLAAYLPYAIQIRYKEVYGGYFYEELFHLETKILPQSMRVLIVNKMLPVCNVTPLLKHPKNITEDEISIIVGHGKDLKLLNDNDTHMLGYFIRAWDSYLKAPLFAIEKLTEMQYDVFGLIDAGLAIDINTLNNPS